MQLLLLVVFCVILPNNVIKARVKLCLFFNSYVAKSLTRINLIVWRSMLLSCANWICIFLFHFLYHGSFKCSFSEGD